MPRKLELNKPAKFNFDLASPRGDARVRIQTDRTDPTGLVAHFNGEILSPTDDVSEPFAVPYPSMLGKPDELRAWHIPASRMREGKNSLEITQTHGDPIMVVFADLACLAPGP